MGRALLSGLPRRRREFVKNIGAVARFNVFGYAVAELSYVRPLDRPDKGWFWQVSLRPGFLIRDSRAS